MDNHFSIFKLKISEWTRAGRFLIFWLELIRMAGKDMRLGIICSVGVAGNYIFFRDLLGGGAVFLADIRVILSFALGVASFFYLAYFLSGYWFMIYRTNYGVCVRDACFQLCVAVVSGLCLLGVGTAPALAAFIAANAVMLFAYKAYLSKRKHFDMTVARAIGLDRSVHDALPSGVPRSGTGKVQIGDELRNCFAVRNGQSHDVAVGDNEVLPLGVGVKEISPKAPRLTVKGVRGSGGEEDLFIKDINPNRYFRDRVWNDCLVPLGNGHEHDKFKSIRFSAEGAQGAKCYVSLPLFGGARCAPGKDMNIYVLVVDSLRSDHFLSAEGMKERGFGALSGMIKDSVVFSNAWTQGPWTLPTYGAFLSGLFPSYHGVNHPRTQKGIGSEIRLLPEILKENGYITNGYATGPRTVPNYGYSRGFDRYHYRITDKELNESTVERAFSWAMEADRKSGARGRQFYYLHILDAHWPYYPPRDREWVLNRISTEDVVRDVKANRKVPGALDFTNEQLLYFNDLYKAELDLCMHHIDRFVAYLKDMDKYDDSLVIIMGDHGTNFAEHGVIGKFDLYGEFVNVGMSVKFPAGLGLVPRLEDSPVEANIDIAPTVLDLAGIDPKGQRFSGKSLLDEAALAGRRFAISEDIYVKRCSISLRDRNYSFIYRTEFDCSSFANFERRNEVFEMYDLKKDRGEKSNIVAEVPLAVKNEFVEALNLHVNSALEYLKAGKRVVIAL
ncbi:MAG: sulfatase [Candidatus Omnitrophica bacterium]|nr:sulfatase [Candidatus Omnitrophota bacterium]